MWIPEKVMLGGMGVVFLMSLVFLLLQRPQRPLTCLVPGVEGDLVSLFVFFLGEERYLSLHKYYQHLQAVQVKDLSGLLAVVQMDSFYTFVQIQQFFLNIESVLCLTCMYLDGC